MIGSGECLDHRVGRDLSAFAELRFQSRFLARGLDRREACERTEAAHLEHDPVLLLGFLNHTHVAAHRDRLQDWALPQLVQMLAPPSEAQSGSLSAVVGEPHPHPQLRCWDAPPQSTSLLLLFFSEMFQSPDFSVSSQIRGVSCESRCSGPVSSVIQSSSIALLTLQTLNDLS